MAENDTTASIRGSDLIRQKLDHGKTWEGQLSLKRKAGDSLVLDTRIVPVSFSSKRIPDNLVYVRQINQPQQDLEANQQTSRRVNVASKSAASKEASIEGESQEKLFIFDGFSDQKKIFFDFF